MGQLALENKEAVFNFTGAQFLGFLRELRKVDEALCQIPTLSGREHRLPARPLPRHALRFSAVDQPARFNRADCLSF